MVLFVFSGALQRIVCSEPRPGLEPVFATSPGACQESSGGNACAVCMGSERGDRGWESPGASLLPAVEMLLLLCATVLLACVVRGHVCLGTYVLV